eukprot:jgi/Botrbrau1/8392/Bobra.0237s0013.1
MEPLDPGFWRMPNTDVRNVDLHVTEYFSMHLGFPVPQPLELNSGPSGLSHPPLYPETGLYCSLYPKAGLYCSPYDIVPCGPISTTTPVQENEEYKSSARGVGSNPKSAKKQTRKRKRAPSKSGFPPLAIQPLSPELDTPMPDKMDLGRPPDVGSWLGADVTLSQGGRAGARGSARPSMCPGNAAAAGRGSSTVTKTNLFKIVKSPLPAGSRRLATFNERLGSTPTPGQALKPLSKPSCSPPGYFPVGHSIDHGPLEGARPRPADGISGLIPIRQSCRVTGSVIRTSVPQPNCEWAPQSLYSTRLCCPDSSWGPYL